MPAKTRTGEYLDRMARGGHTRQKLGEAALAVTEAYCKSDPSSKMKLGEDLADQVQYILANVYGWKDGPSRNAENNVREAFRSTDAGVIQ